MRTARAEPCEEAFFGREGRNAPRQFVIDARARECDECDGEGERAKHPPRTPMPPCPHWALPTPERGRMACLRMARPLGTASVSRASRCACLLASVCRPCTRAHLRQFCGLGQLSEVSLQPKRTLSTSTWYLGIPCRPSLSSLWISSATIWTLTRKFPDTRQLIRNRRAARSPSVRSGRRGERTIGRDGR